ncbi:hypothetical protein IV38_GL001246 [Lactobacillus selangorensis]|uniref:TVP38/TMEM64 family membrane protein n=1 Tax=Lactobacillus selangorensis TaxID=81857 RepID=A0A0R2FVZ3_9LACO|nr:VTT domain-containing protein [Lactobacillus selangorensis]KRN29031.1 hypothetical protein IV38_GL001246 [Lactobacillus selangorensis]KRN32559.1 hypothetical protein IV40_GL000607 [Lactobacillus selangorensis]
MMKRIVRTIVTLIPIAGLAVFIYFIWRLHAAGSQSAVAKLQATLQTWGAYAPIGFMLFQAVQVLVPILPGGLSVLLGSLLFGFWGGILYSYLGIVAGEIVGFLLVRHVGVRLLAYLFSEKSFAKYERIAENQSQNMEKVLIGTLLIPFAPDDIVCLVSGLSKLPFREYLVTIILLKPFSIGLYSFFLTYVFHKTI